jgi:hypothetical protein
MAKKKSRTTSRQLARRPKGKPTPSAKVPKRLVADLRKMIDESRRAVAQTVNTALVWLYWNIGRRIREGILKRKRAEYGEEILSTVSKELTSESEEHVRLMQLGESGIRVAADLIELPPRRLLE